MVAISRIALTFLVAVSWDAPEAIADLADDVREFKTRLKSSQTYEPGTRAEFVLGAGETALLSFSKNAAGVTEFLLHGNGDRLHVIFACEDEPYSSTILTPKRPRDTRTIAQGSAPEWMRCDSQCEFRDDSLHVTFSTEPISADEVRKIQEEQRKARAAKMDKRRRILTWDTDAKVAPIQMLIPHPVDPSLSRLREEYELDKVVAGSADDYERLRRISKWAHDRWQHSGDNTPSKSDPLTILAEAKLGKRFRCVEYAIVVTGCAQALGMPARCLALKREDVETAESGAGHFIAEVWIGSLEKWVFVDGQWDAIPEKDGKPLNAVEFQDAIGRKTPGLKIRSSSNVDEDTYLYWIAPYLYYFDFNVDQQLFGANSSYSEAKRRAPDKGKIMLVPKGAKKPALFQRKSPIKNCTYISDPQAFYPNPASP